jgi:hypothetical protein
MRRNHDALSVLPPLRACICARNAASSAGDREEKPMLVLCRGIGNFALFARVHSISTKKVFMCPTSYAIVVRHKTI